MRKEIRNSVFYALLLLFSGGIFSSCETTDALTCPYIISNPHVEIGSLEEKYTFAGMHFSLFNESEKTISAFTLSFLLYDSDGNNPFIGSNCIVSRCDWKIPADTNTEFIINLDSYISSVPSDPYIVDYIYIREILYTDGSSWKDPFGMYCIREANE